MAKNEKATAPTEPTIAEEPLPETLPESKFPTGVSMHMSGVLPDTSDREKRLAPDPKSPPPGWKGSFNRCGGCGDFLGNANRCPKCSPAYVQPMAFNGGAL